MQLGERVITSLRERIDSAGVTQSAIAARLGVSQAAVSRRLTGDVPLDVNELGEIADLLGIDPSELLVTSTNRTTVPDIAVEASVAP